MSVLQDTSDRRNICDKSKEEDFEICVGVLQKYKGAAIHAEIPNGVVAIEAAFKGYAYLKSVVIPNSVEQIGKDAFQNCAALASIVIPDSVKAIGENAFSGCTYLKTLLIPSSVKTIAASAFSGCTSLEELTLSNGVEVIGTSAFQGCKALKRISIPSSMKKIENAAFLRCSGLKRVDCAGRPEISSSAFDYTSYHRCPECNSGLDFFDRCKNPNCKKYKKY